MKKTSHIYFILWFVSASCLSSPTPCYADIPVALHGDSQLRSTTTVRLSDLFSGVPASLDQDIAQAPLPGKSAVYDARILEKLAEKYRLSWRAASSFDHVKISSAATRITTEELRAAVIRKINDSGVHGDIEAEFDNRTAEINLPADQSPNFSVNNFDFDPVSKRFHFEVVAGDGPYAVNMPVSGKIDIKRKVPTLAHRLESGSIISMTDIDWITVPDERVAANVITSADLIVGRELRHTVNDGEVLHTNDIAAARLVTRGALVTLKIETPYMQLTAQGRALQDGAEGDVVRVNNTQSNRMVEGTVTGPGEVSVHTGQKVALAQ